MAITWDCDITNVNLASKEFLTNLEQLAKSNLEAREV